MGSFKIKKIETGRSIFDTKSNISLTEPLKQHENEQKLTKQLKNHHKTPQEETKPRNRPQNSGGWCGKMACGRQQIGQLVGGGNMAASAGGRSSTQHSLSAFPA